MKFFKEKPLQKTEEEIPEENKNVHAYVIEQEIKDVKIKLRELENELRPLFDAKSEIEKKMNPLLAERADLEKKEKEIREKYGNERVSAIYERNYNSEKQDWFIKENEK